MKRLAVIGASYLQLPLIEKAKSLGYETHVFAWQAGDVGEEAADVFHPISILEKEAVLEACRPLGLCGVCTIGTDLETYIDNSTAQIIAGEVELTDEWWNSFVKRINDMGADQLLDVYRQALERTYGEGGAY